MALLNPDRHFQIGCELAAHYGHKLSFGKPSTENEEIETSIPRNERQSAPSNLTDLIRTRNLHSSTWFGEPAQSL